MTLQASNVKVIWRSEREVRPEHRENARLLL